MKSHDHIKSLLSYEDMKEAWELAISSCYEERNFVKFLFMNHLNFYPYIVWEEEMLDLLEELEFEG